MVPYDFLASSESSFKSFPGLSDRKFVAIVLPEKASSWQPDLNNWGKVTELTSKASIGVLSFFKYPGTTELPEGCINIESACDKVFLKWLRKDFHIGRGLAIVLARAEDGSNKFAVFHAPDDSNCVFALLEGISAAILALNSKANLLNISKKVSEAKSFTAQTSYHRSVASVLADALALCELCDNDNSVATSRARRFLNFLNEESENPKLGRQKQSEVYKRYLDYRYAIIKHLKRKITPRPTYRHQTFSEIDPFSNERMLLLSSFESNISVSEESYEIPEETAKKLEDVSIELAEEFKDFIDGHNEVKRSRYLFRSELDRPQDQYKYEVGCLGAILEFELNASIVQLIRQRKYNIKMPDFFQRYDPDPLHQNCTIKAGRFVLNFNKQRWYDEAESIPVGQLLYYLKGLYACPSVLNNVLQPFLNKSFFYDAGIVSNWRGGYSHPSKNKISKNDFILVWEAFNRIMDRSIDDIVSLKEQLRS